MNTQRFRLLTLAALALAASGTALAQATITHDKALAGGVTPGDTAGYPVTISQPGHYKLMSNLVVPAGMPGIQIMANNVTLDLNGFGVSGPVSCPNPEANQPCSHPFVMSVFGIYVGEANAMVRNGSITGFQGGGLFAAHGVRATDLSLRSNAGTGLWVATNTGSSLLERITAERNGNSGIAVGGAIALIKVQANYNRSQGIELVQGTTGHMTESQAHGNYQHGLALPPQGASVLIRGSAFTANQGVSGNIFGTPKSGGGNLNGNTLF